MYTGPDSIHGLGEIWRVAWYGSRINTDRFPERAPKEQAFRGTLPREIVLDLGFLSYSDNIFTDCMCKLFSTWKAFNFFCFLIYYEKSDQGGSMPKFRQCLSAHGYSFGPHFIRLIQSKVLMLVKLTSLYVCVCVFFLLLQIDSQHYVRAKMDQLGLSWDVDKK